MERKNEGLEDVKSIFSQASEVGSEDSIGKTIPRLVRQHDPGHSGKSEPIIIFDRSRIETLTIFEVFISRVFESNRDLLRTVEIFFVRY
jgi:hypothetical protein